MQYNVQLKRLPGHEQVLLPQKMSDLASGFDLHASLQESLTIQPGERVLIPTGIAISMSPELEAQIRPRSGLAYKQGITVLNSPGTIDADYRGEIKVLIVHLGQEPFTIEPNERIAQMVFQIVPSITFQEVSELTDTKRGAGGFGHTGTK